MFERFTAYARRAVVTAQEEARDLNHNYIGTEHLLLALLHRPEGLPHQEDGGAADILEKFGITLAGTREEVVAKVGRGTGKMSGHIPFTPRAKKTLELALREALQLHHTYIGTEHLLLGLIRENDGVAAQIMRDHADLLAIRAEVLDRVPVGDAEDGKEGVAGAVASIRRQFRERLGFGRGEAEGQTARATPAADATLTQAALLAGTAPVGSHHLLLAALTDPNSAAARAFQRLGVDLDQVREALRDADVTGTSDEPPEEAGRRQMVVQVTDEIVTVVLIDPLIVATAKAALKAVHANAKQGETSESGETGETNGASEEGETGASKSATATVIRGDDPAAASLAAVWQELRKSLAKIAETAASEPPEAA